MANNKINAQMQIDVSFVGKTTELVKSLQKDIKSLDFGSTLLKDFESNLKKGFKETLGNLDKLSEGLGKGGLSPKQYTDFFNAMKLKILDSTRAFGNLKTGLEAAFKSDANKQAIKQLEDYKKKIEEINSLLSKQKSASTRAQTSKNKLKDLGIDLDNSYTNRMLKDILDRRASGNKTLTPSQSGVLGKHAEDEKSLKRIVTLYEQYLGHLQKESDLNKQAQQMTGLKGGTDTILQSLEKKVVATGKLTLTQEEYNRVLAFLNENQKRFGDLLNLDTQLIKGFEEELPRATLEAEKLARASATVKEVLGQFGIVFSAAAIVRGFQQLARSAFEFYKSLDSALNEIYIVSNLSSSAVNKLKTDFITMAKDTGMALDDVTRAAVLFYQQGLNTDEVMEMTRVTSEFAKVAGIDATDAADKLTAAVNGYCLAAEDASMVADKFNKVAAASAADIDELSTAFSKAAAQANQAGVGMDNYLAYLATMIEVTREAPENIGTSLKTIMSRMQQVKEGGTTEDGETDVNQVETALRSVGIELRDVNGELRDLEDVFDELGPKWNNLNRNTQAYLGTVIAGTRQQSRFVSLMQNWDRVLDLANQSANSAGQQALMHAKAMDSIESNIQQFNVAWQEFVSNLTDSGAIKVAVKAITGLVNLFNGGNKPVILMATAIGLLSTKLADLSLAANSKLKGFPGNMLAKAQDNKEITQMLKMERDSNKEKIAIAENQIKIEQQALDEKIKKQEVLYSTEEKITKEKQKQLDLDKGQIKEAQDKIDKKKADVERMKKENQGYNAEIMSSYSRNIMAASIALTTASVALSEYDENLAGAVGTLGTLGMSASQFMTGNWIGGTITAVMALYQAFQLVANWEENIANKLSEAVNKVDEAAKKAGNLTTGINSSKSLIKEYETLNRKIHKTAEEQDRLNELAQQLADSHELDVISDGYGNLSVSIDDVTASLKEMEIEQQEALKELKEAELEGLLDATGGIFNTNTVDDYYNKLLITNRNVYKGLLSGVEEELSDEARAVSNSVATEFSDNLVDSIYSQIESNSKAYGGETTIGAMTRINDSINTKLEDDDWNELYVKLGELQERADEMSYDEVAEELEKFYNTWGIENDITLEEWNTLVNAINSTVFKNDSLLDFYNKIDGLMARIGGEYYTNKEGTGAIDNINKKIEEVEKAQKLKAAAATYAGGVAGGTAFGLGGAAIGAKIGGTVGQAAIPVPVVGAAIGAAVGVAAGATVGYVTWANSETGKQYRALKKTRKALEKEREEILKQIDEENDYIHSTDEAERWVEAQSKVVDSLKKLNTEQQSYLGNIETLTNFDELDIADTEKYAESIKGMINAFSDMDFDSDAQRANFMITYAQKMLDDPNLTQEVKDKWQKVIDDAMDSLELPTSYSFTQIFNEVDNITSSLRKTNELMHEFNEQGSLAFESFGELAKIIDSISIDDLFSMSNFEKGENYVRQYLDAIEQLNIGIDENTGRITLNGDALEKLQNIQQIQAQSEIKNMKNQAIAKKYQILTEIAYIDAQIAGAEAAIEVLKAKRDSSVDAETVIDAATTAMQQDFTEETDSLQSNFSTDVQNMNTWTLAVVRYLGIASEAWGKYYAAAAGEKTDLSGLIENVKKVTSEMKFEKSSWIWDEAGDDGILSGQEINDAIVRLEGYITGLNNLKTKYQGALELENSKIEWLDKISQADLSNLGLDLDSEEIDKYIGKLQELMNLRSKISLMEHRESMLSQYQDISSGEDYGKYLHQRLELNEKLMGQYDELVTKQKQFTNGYKAYIEESPFASVFSFDEFGRIIINMEEYNKLNDEAVDGQKSMKEQADDIYETYTQMYEDLQKDADNYMKILKTIIDIQETIIDGYIDTEQKAADAVKEIYQDILDTKKKAIDDEIEALNKLKEARDRANKSSEDSKELSNLQTDLQRSLMDTSGASDIAFINTQKAIQDKLEEMAEDKYTQQLDDIINALEEEQNSLQENFDFMFENTEWLHSFLRDCIMGDKGKLADLFSQTKEYQNASPERRKQLTDDWMGKFSAYIGEFNSTNGLVGFQEELEKNRKDYIESIDESLQSTIVDQAGKIVGAINGLQVKINNSSSSGGGGGGYNYNPPSTDTETDETKDQNTPPPINLNDDSTDEASFRIGSSVRSKEQVEQGGLQWVRTYTGIENGKVKQSAPVVGWPSFWSGFDMDNGDAEIVDRKNVNGTWYYLIKALEDQKRWFSGHQLQYKTGGMVYGTGPAWLDGTPQRPEAVLNALQTAHFIDFTKTLDRMYSTQQGLRNLSTAVNIDNILFTVESMSSVEDGERAFNMFVDKFKEIGNQRGIKIDSFKNRL